MELNRKSFFTFCIILLLFNSCCKLKNDYLKNTSDQFNDSLEKFVLKDNRTVPIIYTDTVDKTIRIVINDQLAQLEFKEINKSEFENYKKKYNSNLSLDSTKIILDKSSITIQTSKARIKFNSINFATNNITEHGQTWMDYKGFVENRKLYVFESWCFGEFEIGSLFLIDSISNIKYEICSVFDNPFEPPVLSPDNQYMAFYTNGMMTGSGNLPEHNSFIIVVKLVKANGFLFFNQVASFGTSSWNIKEVVWFDDNSLALKINTPKYNGESWIDNFSYLKAIMPKN